MLTDEVFQNPDIVSMDAAHADGLLNWHRRDRLNPYEVAHEAVSDALWYAWDSGRRLGIFLNGVRKAESDRVNADTLQRLKAAGIELLPARRGLFGGAR